MKDRMRSSLRQCDMTLTSLAESTGYSYHNVRNWVTGDTRLPAHFLAAFARSVPVSRAWLLLGEGESSELSPQVATLEAKAVRAVLSVSGEPARSTEEVLTVLSDLIVLAERAEGGRG